MSTSVENISVIIAGRDRFSTTFGCLDALFKNTGQAFEAIVVLGGAPAKTRAELESKYAGRVRFIFKDGFLNPSQSRNLGLKAAGTRLAVIMDNDVEVMTGWLEPLLRCQADTQAAVVVPIILDAPHRIHTAGNTLFITQKNGVSYASKELCFGGLYYNDGNNLKRTACDYTELHCQLVDIQTALRLGVYDEEFREVSECDAGLTWGKANCGQWFEPASVVFYNFPQKIRNPEDIKFFMWKWDMREIKKSYDYFRSKWGMDITEGGDFSGFLVFFNDKVGIFSRLCPSRAFVALDLAHEKLKMIAGLPHSLWRKAKTDLFGKSSWDR